MNGLNITHVIVNVHDLEGLARAVTRYKEFMYFSFQALGWKADPLGCVM